MDAEHEPWSDFVGGREALEERIAEWDYVAAVEYLNAWVQHGWGIDRDIAFRALTLMVFYLHQEHHL